MSTINFYKKNANHVFAIDCQSDFDFDDTMSLITDELFANGWEPDSKYTDDRVYSGHIFATKSTEVSVGRCRIDVTVRAIVRNGYYDGANLDWDLLIDGEDYNPDYIDVDAARDILKANYLYADNIGFCKMQAPNLCRRLQKSVNLLTHELEEVYANFTETLVVVGIFSNGAASYAPYTSRSRMISAVNGLLG